MAQSPASPDPKPFARFPYVAAFLCVACVGAAGWTWMRYSYAWDVTAGRMSRDFAEYVRVDRRLEYDTVPQPYLRVSGVTWVGDGKVTLHDPADRNEYVDLILDDGDARPPPDTECVYYGRRKYVPFSRGLDLYLDTTASRFHGASIAGLVVGAMGVFVFTVAFKHWLKGGGRHG